MKTINHLALLCSAFFTLAMCAHSASSSSLSSRPFDEYTDPWDLVEEILITQAQKESTWQWDETRKAATTIGVTTVGAAVLGSGLYLYGLLITIQKKWVGLEKMISIRDQTTLFRQERPMGALLNVGMLLALPALWWVGKKSMQGLNREAMREAQLDRMDALVDTWNSIQPFFPHELYKTFDELEALKKTKSAAYLGKGAKALNSILEKLTIHKHRKTNPKGGSPEKTENA